MASYRSTRRSRLISEIFAVVSGSFNRFLPQIREVIESLSEVGIIVLSPKSVAPISEINGFVILEKDTGSPAQIELKHLSAIKRSDFLYIVNPEGYVGPSVACEIGYAISNNIPIYASEPPSDEVFKDILQSSTTLKQIRNRALRHKSKLRNTALKPSPTLTDLQTYVAGIVKGRGFSTEELNNVVLLLVEEIGELAKAIRFESGIKVDKQYQEYRKSLGSELADCFIYLTDIANLANVNIENALRQKETLNLERTWIQPEPQAATPLTTIELKILNYIAQGYLNKEIAYQLNISETTIKHHIYSILEKLSVKNRSQAVAAAIRQRVIPLKY